MNMRNAYLLLFNLTWPKKVNLISHKYKYPGKYVLYNSQKFKVDLNKDD